MEVKCESMQEFIDTKQVKLKTIFEDESKYEIPRFQREYSWQDEQIDDFWKDLIDNFNSSATEPYFFGTFVLIASDKPEQYKVVDGQQRIATSITLLCVLRDFLFEYGKERDADNVQYYIKVDEPSTSSYPFRLQMSRNNQDFFLGKILNLDKASDKNHVIFENISKRNKGLAYAYHFFYDKIFDELKQNEPFGHNVGFLDPLKQYVPIGQFI